MFAWAQPGVNKLLMNVNSNFFSKFLKVSGNFEKYGFCKISTHGFFPSCRAKQHQCWSLMYIVQTLMDQIAHTWHLYTGPFSSCSANNILPFATGLATLGRLARSDFKATSFSNFVILAPTVLPHPPWRLPIWTVRQLMSLIISRQKNCTRVLTVSANLRAGCLIDEIIIRLNRSDSLV